MTESPDKKMPADSGTDLKHIKDKQKDHEELKSRILESN